MALRQWQLYLYYGVLFVVTQLLLVVGGILLWSQWTEEHFDQQMRSQLRGTHALVMKRLDPGDPDAWPAVMKELQRDFAYPVALRPISDVASLLDADRRRQLLGGTIVVSADSSYSYQRVHHSGRVLVLGDFDTAAGEGSPTDDPVPLGDWNLLLLMIVAIVIPLYLLIYRLCRDISALEDAARQLLDHHFEPSAPRMRTHLLRPLGTALNHVAEQMRILLDGQRLMSHALAHEIRTPLARLAFTGELLRDAAGSRAAASLLDELDADVARLQHLTSAGLEYARFGRMPLLERSRIVLRPLVAKLWDEIDTGDGPALVVEMEDAASLRGNAPAVELALRNVLANAYRHARSTVRIAMHAQPGTGIVDIDDDGPGIPAPMRERAFHPYIQLDGNRDGFGLGLAMVRVIMARHGGTATILDAPLGGARFQLRFPNTDGSTSPLNERRARSL